jgi:hypothetical protein
MKKTQLMAAIFFAGIFVSTGQHMQGASTHDMHAFVLGGPGFKLQLIHRRFDTRNDSSHRGGKRLHHRL